MDDLIVSKANSIVKSFKGAEDFNKDLNTVIKVLQGSVKPSKSKKYLASVQFAYLKLFDELIVALKGDYKQCVLCLQAHNE